MDLNFDLSWAAGSLAADSTPSYVSAPAASGAAEAGTDAEPRPWPGLMAVRPAIAAALQDYLTANYARLRQRLQRRLGCGDAAGECLHETWLHLQRVTIADSIQNPEAYLLRMAYHLAIDLMRSARARPVTDVANEDLAAWPDPAPGPAAIAQARSELRAVEQALRGLPPRYQSVLVALRIEGKTREDVAHSQGVSVRRIDAMLRQALDQCSCLSSPAASRISICP